MFNIVDAIYKMVVSKCLTGSKECNFQVTSLFKGESKHYLRLAIILHYVSLLASKAHKSWYALQ